MMQRVEKTFAGRKLVIETGRMAKQAAGSALVQFGDTMVLAAVTVSDNESPLAFFPLLVEYRRRPTPPARSRAASSSAKGARSDDEILVGAHHRPLDPPALPGRLQERSPGLHLRHLGRPGERRRRARARRRVVRAERVEDSVHGARSPACASAASRTSGCSTRRSSSSRTATWSSSSPARRTRSYMVEGGALEVQRRGRASKRSRSRRRASAS